MSPKTKTPKGKNPSKVKNANNLTKLGRKVRSLERSNEKQERQIEDLQKAVSRLQELLTVVRNDRIG